LVRADPVRLPPAGTPAALTILPLSGEKNGQGMTAAFESGPSGATRFGGLTSLNVRLITPLAIGCGHGFLDD